MKWEEARKQLVKELPLWEKIWYYIDRSVYRFKRKLLSKWWRLKCKFGIHVPIEMTRMKNKPQYCLLCGRSVNDKGGSR